LNSVPLRTKQSWSAKSCYPAIDTMSGRVDTRPEGIASS
jgi:hypothetical protein